MRETLIGITPYFSFVSSIFFHTLVSFYVTSLGKRPVSACDLARKRIIVWHKKNDVIF
jgi:hypothetical protein